MNIKLLSVCIASSVACTTLGSTPLWLRDVKISPDGKTIAFTYKGDIWTVPTTGGNARRITSNPSYETTPVWSPDSKKLAFASDRNGNFDIFLTDVYGNLPTRLTYNSAAETPESFSADGKSVLYSAAIQDPASSVLFPSGRLTELYSVPVEGGKSSQILATPAQRISFDRRKGKNGNFVYQDVKGFEDEWRKHHTSSVTRDLWMYDASSGKHTNLTSRGGEDRDPVLAGDTLYFLSERNGGSMNVFRAPITDVSAPVAVTSFKKHPVRFLSHADNGLLCYAYDGEIYTQLPDGKPTKVKIDIVDDVVEDPVKVTARPSYGVPSPDGKSIAFISRGDVYVTSADYSTTKRITETPEEERNVSWSPDGKKLYYDSQRNGNSNIYVATRAHDDDPDFANATVIAEKALIADDDNERANPQVSPDGKSLAFVANRNKLMVMDLGTKKVRQLTDGSLYPSQSGYFDFSWSPDSKWIVFEVIDRKHDPYSDLAIINVADGNVTDLTNTGYFAENPSWVLDGNAIMYLTDRYGMRSHASWGSQTDAVLVFLNQDAYDRFRLSEEDYAFLKDREKNAKKDDSKDEKNADKEKKSSKTITVELEGIDNRRVRLTPMSTNMRDAFMTADGATLYYLMQAPDGMQLWKLGLRKDEHKMLQKLDGATSLVPTADGKTVIVGGRSMRKLDPKSDKLTAITTSASATINPAEERAFMYDYMVREEGKRFYNKNMHGVDWKALTNHYRKFLPHIANNYDFAEMLSEILGELNVSHTGGRYRPTPPATADRTSSLGLLYDIDYKGKGLKVAEVIVNGPFSQASSSMAPSAVITAINGVEIPVEGADKLLNDLAGKKTLVTFTTGDKTEHSEVITPISQAKLSTLMYDRWVRARAADVDRWSNGRLGYVHIESMGDPSFRSLYSDVLGKYNDREGIVIDVRWNGGGRLHEDIEVMFSGEKYLTQEIRGVDACDMPSRRWNKPSIMLMSEACYSNAHGTPWVYKHKGIGKLVGAPVPGTMTSVNWVTMQDPSMVFGIPVIGYRTAEGTYLENSQLEPDIKVFNDPVKAVQGHDEQLHTAVLELLKQIDNK